MGVREYVIIGLILLVVVLSASVKIQHSEIADLNVKIGSLETAKADLEGKITLQNDKIEALGKTRDAIQDSLNKVSKDNKRLSDELSKWRTEISIAAPPKDCNAGLDELRTFHNRVKNVWDTKQLPQ